MTSSHQNIRYDDALLSRPEQDITLLLPNLPSFDAPKETGLLTTGMIERLDGAYAQIANCFQIIDRHLIASETDLDGTITYVSQAFCKISGYDKEELIGHSFGLLRDPDVDSDIYDSLWSVLRQEKTWEGEISNIGKQGNRYWMRNYIKPKRNYQGEIIGYTQISENITNEKRIEQLAAIDPLTQIYNRAHLDRILQSETACCCRHFSDLSIILIDIDHFKQVNDRHGHLIGDQVLQQTAQIFNNQIRQADTLGRWGGEEFLIIAPKTDQKGARRLAEKLRTALEKHNFSGTNRQTASFGISCYRHGDNQESFLQRADRSLYCAKNNGRNQIGPHL